MQARNNCKICKSIFRGAPVCVSYIYNVSIFVRIVRGISGGGAALCMSATCIKSFKL